MKTVRLGTFETNSSSCHCVTIMKPSVYEAIKEQKSVMHNVFNHVEEYSETSAIIHNYDLIPINELHEEFLLEYPKCANLEYFKDNMESYFKGMWEAFESLIQDVNFFKKLIFFEEKKPTFKLSEIYDGEITRVDSEEDDFNKTHTPEWIIAWIFRAICCDSNINFLSFNLDFEDENLSIEDFEKEGGVYKAEHDISC